MDLAFIFGANGKHASDTFKAEKEIAKKIVASQKISKSETLVGAVVYDSDARLAFKIGEALNESSTIESIDKIQRYRDGNNVEKALELSRSRLLGVDNIAQRDALKKVVLFLDKTDEISKRAQDIAKQLKDAGIKIIVISIGRETDVKDIIEIPSGIKGLVQTNDPSRDLDNVATKVEAMLMSGMLKLL